MAIVQPAGEQIVQKLRQAIARLEDDMARVELWAGALNGFAKPVPGYDHGQTRFDLPPAAAPERASQKLPRAMTLRSVPPDRNAERD